MSGWLEALLRKRGRQDVKKDRESEYQRVKREGAALRGEKEEGV